MTQPKLVDLAVGDIIGSRTITVDRSRLVRYAGASGDFNPIHWNDVFAQSVGLPGVIAHGMFTMGAALTLVEEWCGDPTRIVDYQTRFTRPVPVPNPGTSEIEVVGKIVAINPEDQTATVDLSVSFSGQKVLGKSQAVVRW